MTESSPPAGWYPDNEGRMRWWDGSRWTDQFQDTHQAVPTHAAEPTPTRTSVTTSTEQKRRPWLIPTIVGVVALLIGIGIGSSGSTDSTSGDSAQEESAKSGATAADLDKRETELNQREEDVADREKELQGAEKELKDAQAEAKASTIGNGVYEVGKDMKPGRYKSGGPEDASIPFCSYRVSSDEAGEKIIAIENSQGPGVVSVARGQYFFSQNCQEWKRQ